MICCSGQRRRSVRSRLLRQCSVKHFSKRSVSVPPTVRQRFRASYANAGFFGGQGNREVVAVLDIENVNAAAILITADLPDEARLALLDLDPTEPALHGKVLGWDAGSQQWVTVEAPVTQVSPPPGDRI
jgi:hypothetical protein